MGPTRSIAFKDSEMLTAASERIGGEGFFDDPFPCDPLFPTALLWIKFLRSRPSTVPWRRMQPGNQQTRYDGH
jgi:hypothetical protein